MLAGLESLVAIRMRSRVERHTTVRSRRNNLASTWCDDQAFMEGMIRWIECRCASSAAAKEPATPPATHTNTGRHRREGGETANTKTQSSQYTWLTQVSSPEGTYRPGIAKVAL